MSNPSVRITSQYESICPGRPAIKACTRNQPAPITRIRKKAAARKAAARSARSQALLQAEASKPAASAQHIALALTTTDIKASVRLTPPSRKGIVNTGTTASPSVRARNPCAKPLATTMSVPFNGVRNSSPKVPSRRSRLMQSAVNIGTRSHIAQKSVQWRAPNNWRPKPISNPLYAPNSRLANKGITVLLPSHQLPEVQELCNRVAIVQLLHLGKLVA